MGLEETLAGLAKSHDEQNRDKDMLPIRIDNWNNRCQDLYRHVLQLIRDVDPQDRITSKQVAFQAHSGPLGNYKGRSLQLGVFGKIIEFKPFSGLHDEEVDTVHMSKVGRGERIRFLYRDHRWDLAMQPKDEHDAYVEGRKPVWTYQSFTAESFKAALDFLLRAGEKA